MTETSTEVITEVQTREAIYTSWLEASHSAIASINLSSYSLLNATYNNATINSSDSEYKGTNPTIVFQSIIAGLLCLVTVLGNVMVMISFKMNKQLQTVSNYFLLSLATADFSIGLISMPLFTMYTLNERWTLGPFICDTWLALDYLNSNASVLNLLIISFDRYFSVTRPLTYRAKRTTKRAAFMIASAWVISLALWPPWIYAWPYIEGKRSVEADQCYIQFLKTNSYVTFGTAIAAFYVPVTVMCALYYKIWRETEKRKKGLWHLQANKQRDGSKNSTSSDDPQEEEVKKQRSSPSVPNDSTYLPTSLTVPTAPKSRFQLFKERLLKACKCDRDTDGGDEDSTSHGSQGAITPASVETPIQSSSRTTSITFKSEHAVTKIDALMLEERNGPKCSDASASTSRAPPHSISSDSVYTVLIRLPQQVSGDGEEESPASIKMIIEEEEEIVQKPPNQSDGSAGLRRQLDDCGNSHEGSLRIRETAIETLRLPLNAKLVHKQMTKVRGAKKKKKQHDRKQEKKAAKTLSAILLAFIITWTPYNVLVLVMTLVSCGNEECIPKALWHFVYYLCYINSTVNPLCYALGNENFRKTYIRILTCKWQNKKGHLANHGYFS